MNPLGWSREHQLALALAVLVGVGLGTVLGYLVYAASGEAVSFGYWLGRPIWSRALWWGLFGGIIGAALVYARQLLRT